MSPIRIDCRGCRNQSGSLLSPTKWQHQPLQPVRREGDGLSAIENLRDDIGCQEGEGERAADLAFIAAVAFGEVADRCRPP